MDTLSNTFFQVRESSIKSTGPEIDNRQSLGNLELTGGRLPIVSNIIVENPSDHCLVMATLLLCIFLEKVNTGFT